MFMTSRWHRSRAWHSSNSVTSATQAVYNIATQEFNIAVLQVAIFIDIQKSILKIVIYKYNMITEKEHVPRKI